MKTRSLHGWMCSSQHLGSVAEQVSLHSAALPFFGNVKKCEKRGSPVTSRTPQIAPKNSHGSHRISLALGKKNPQMQIFVSLWKNKKTSVCFVCVFLVPGYQKKHVGTCLLPSLLKLLHQSHHGSQPREFFSPSGC